MTGQRGELNKGSHLIVSFSQHRCDSFPSESHFSKVTEGLNLYVLLADSPTPTFQYKQLSDGNIPEHYPKKTAFIG